MRRNNRRNFNVSVAYNVARTGRHPHARRVDLRRRSGPRTSRAKCRAESVSGDGPHHRRRPDRARQVDLRRRRDHRHPRSTAASTRRAPAATCCCAASRRGSIDAGSVSGNMMLEDVECARVEAQTVSGSVRFGGAAGPRRPLRAEVALRRRPAALGGNTGFEVEAKSFSGSVRSDFPFGTQRRYRARPLAALDPRRLRRRQRRPRPDDVLAAASSSPSAKSA